MSAPAGGARKRTDRGAARAAADGGDGAYLDNLWYYALQGHRLKRNRVVHRTLLGEPLLLGRDEAGGVFALRDICPHRGIPLSYGRFDGREVECAYHGWRFGTDGHCAAIPSLVPGQKFNLDRMAVRRYPCREVQGNIWVYFGDRHDALPEVPRVPGIGDVGYRLAESMEFPSDLDHAVIGLMDPAHGPFVHRSWWWRTGSSIHVKEKRFAPSPLGFKMVRHRPSSNSRAYVILGGVPETEISFQLPGVRIEHVQAGRHVFCGLTAVTPLTATRTEVNHVIYWTMPWLTLLKPLLKPFARAFLAQDRRVVARQQEGLAFAPKLMLINDADVQARWYFKLKNEYRRAQAEAREFVNPVPETTLRWRS